MAKVGVFGSDVREVDPAIAKLAQQLGCELARRGHELYTGGCNGYPHEVAVGAFREGGRVVAVSPAGSREEHAGSCGYPVDGYAAISFTGEGWARRSVRLVDAVEKGVVVQGRQGTLQEIALMICAGKDLGVLLGSGGASDYLPGFLKGAGIMENSHADDAHLRPYLVQTGLRAGRRSRVVYRDHPVLLVEALFDEG
ncbi:MAG: hypothetical protein HY520_00120 [Candidatus Aenigmarchaeota archaeon]|nr:hypothetical protein [Candidatus Aenigmarchaeota archaeon]